MKTLKLIMRRSLRFFLWAAIAVLGAIVPAGCSDDSNDTPDVPDEPKQEIGNPLNFSREQLSQIERLNKYSLMIARDVISHAPQGENTFVAPLQVMNMYSQVNEHAGLTENADNRNEIFGPLGADYGFESLTSKLMNGYRESVDDNSVSYFGSVWADRSSADSSDSQYLGWIENSNVYDLYERPETDNALISGINGWLSSKNPAGNMAFGLMEISPGLCHALGADFSLVPKDAMVRDEHIRDVFIIDELHMTSYSPLISEHAYWVEDNGVRHVTAQELENDRYLLYSITPNFHVSLRSSLEEFAMTIKETDLSSWISDVGNTDLKVSLRTPALNIDCTSVHFTDTQLSALALNEVSQTAVQNVHFSFDKGAKGVGKSDEQESFRRMPFIIIVVERSTNAIVLFGLVNHL